MSTENENTMSSAMAAGIKTAAASYNEPIRNRGAHVGASEPNARAVPGAYITLPGGRSPPPMPTPTPPAHTAPGKSYQSSSPPAGGPIASMPQPESGELGTTARQGENVILTKNAAFLAGVQDTLARLAAEEIDGADEIADPNETPSS